MNWYLPDFQEDCDVLIPKVGPLLEAEDRPGIARLLHEIEAKSAADCKLGDLWRPTPFPIETAGADG